MYKLKSTLYNTKDTYVYDFVLTYAYNFLYVDAYVEVNTYKSD